MQILRKTESGDVVGYDGRLASIKIDDLVCGDEGSAEKVTIKGVYTSGTVAVAVPSITDPDIAKVDVDLSAMTFAPAVGDLVVAIPLEALPSNARLQGAWVSATDTVQVVYGSEGGNVTGANKNHKFIIFDLT